MNIDYNKVFVGIEFEFHSDIVNLPLVLSKFLNGYDIVVPYKELMLPKNFKNKEKNKNKILIYHSGFDISNSNNKFLLEIDTSGGAMYELITCKLEYKEAIKVIKKVFDFINNYCYVTDKSSIHFNISIDGVDLTNLDVVKFALEFDEDFIYNLFPERKNVVYTMSVKNLDFLNDSNFDYLILDKNYVNNQSFNDILNVINKNLDKKVYKYYGINFIKKDKNYLEFRYIGGDKYTKKLDSVLKCLNYFIESLYKNYNKKLDFNDLISIKNIYLNNYNLHQTLSSYKSFISKYPNIKIYVDLKSNELNIKTYWNSGLKKVLFELLKSNSLINKNNQDKDFYINYNTSSKYNKKIEIKNLKAYNLKIDDCLFLDCEFENCNINNSVIYNCHVKNSFIEESDILGNITNVISSKLTNSNIGNDVNVEYSWISSPNKRINGNIKNSVIRYGIISVNSNIVNSTIFTDYINFKLEGDVPSYINYLGIDDKK